MLTPDYLDGCTDDAVALIRRFQNDVVADAARRFARLGGVTQATIGQAELAQEAGLLYSDVVKRLAETTNSLETEIREVFEEAGVRAITADDRVYRMVGRSPLPVQQSPWLWNILEADAKKTNRQLKNLTMTTAVTAQTQFIQAATDAQMLVSRGGLSHTQAVRNQLKTLARQGVTTVRYNNRGRRPKQDKVDVALRRAVLTGVNQTAATLQLLRMDEMDWDLVETTAHVGARPSHAEWQGLVFSRTGQGYPDFYAVTGYGEGGGLCGWNCRHNFSPYFAGISRGTHSRDDLAEMENRVVEVDGEELTYYAATQVQREKEVEIRELKRELTALDAGARAAEDEMLAKALQADFALTSLTLKTKERELASFTRTAGLQRQREREQATGFGISTAQKAVWADKKARNTRK